MHKPIIAAGLFFSILAANAAAPAPASTTDVEIYASVYSTNSWKEHNFDEVGMYRFSADSYSRSLVYQDPDIDASGGGVMTPDFYFCTSEMNFGSWVDVTHYIINPDTWRTVSSLRDGLYGAVATDMTYDPVTAKIYGCFNGDNEGDPMVFGTLDEADGSRFRIADIETPWIACSVDRSGNLFAVDMAGNLMSVNKVNGATTTLGNLGFTATNRSTGAIDPRTGIFYVVVTNSVDNPDEYADYKLNESYLYAVDIPSATATRLYRFEDGEALGGMYIPGPVAEDGAPAAATSLALDFPAGALSGTVSFDIPATTFDGNPATGSVSYLVRANGSLLAQGSAPVGSHVSAPASVDEAAMYDVEVMLSNSTGNSPRTKISQWIGPDMPLNITDVNATCTDGTFTISWTAPTQGQNGGYVDPDAISYIVTRQPDGAIVASGLKATSFVDTPPTPAQVTMYHYEVTLVYNDTRLMPVSSPRWPLGSVSLPYTATFGADDALDLFTVIDVDGDKIEWYREWEFYIESTDELIPVASYPYSSSRKADDWLITPPVTLEASKTYEISYSALTDYEGDEPLLEIYCGSAPDAAAMTARVMEPKAITSLLPATDKVTLTVPADGVYFIGFHACSEPYRSAIALTEIKISEVAAAPAAADVAVTALNVPAEFASGSAATITATVANLGTEPAAGISVILYRDNIEIDRATVASIDAAATSAVEFIETLTPFHNAEPVYKVVAEYTPDTNLDNNSLSAEPATLTFSAGQPVIDLGAVESAGDVHLSWSAPAAAGTRAAAAPLTESFENSTPFAIDGAAGWKFVSLDGAPANEMELATIPHLGTGEDIAFIVLDATGIDASFSAHSGTKSIMGVWNDDYNDDWAISPLLSGDAQTVTFMARSYDDYYLENLAVMYSTTDTDDISSFEYLPAGGTYDEISHEWTLYSFDLPEGAKRFAIGYVSECKVAALIDDITFIPAASAPAATPVAYNVYRDGIKLNTAPVVETSFIDRPLSTKTPVYHVTAIYSDGESRLSNPVGLTLTGIGSVSAAASTLTASTADGSLTLTAGSATVYSVITVDGRRVASGKLDRGATATLRLAPGLYIVTDNRAALRVVVR